MAHPIFHLLALSGAIRLFCRSLFHAVLVGWMNLIESRTAIQFLGRISEHFLVSGTAIDSLPVMIDDRNHVGGIFSDQLKQFVAIRQLPSHPLQLQVLVHGVDIEQ